MSREYRFLAVGSLAFFVILEAMLVAAIFYWDSFSEALEQGSAIVRILASAIPAAQDALTLVDEHGMYGYNVGQHFFKGCNTLGIAAAVFFSVGIVAGESHRGTLEIVLARPISRTRHLLERWLGGAVALVIPVFLTSLTIPWLSAQVGEEQELFPYVLCAVHQSLALLAVYSVSTLVSALTKNPIKIALAQLFFYTFHFAIYIIREINEYSLYKLVDMFDYVDIKTNGHLDGTVVWGFVATAAASLIAAVLAYRRRLP